MVNNKEARRPRHHHRHRRRRRSMPSSMLCVSFVNGCEMLMIRSGVWVDGYGWIMPYFFPPFLGPRRSGGGRFHEAEVGWFVNCLVGWFYALDMLGGDALV